MVDLSFLEKFTNGDVSKMKRYITIYLSIAPKTFQDMQQHLRDSDWEQLRIKAHSLKPQADYMGLPKLKAGLMEIENNIAQGFYDNLDNLFDIAYQTYFDTEESLKNFVNSN